DQGRRAGVRPPGGGHSSSRASDLHADAAKRRPGSLSQL
ncbi:MAG: hypothetical protein AVDCRST_MAG66-665, partial [uncultured Pseudonocardia sp.]